MQRRFAQVDVFTAVPMAGNPLAVVIDSEGLTTEEMQRFANWTNLSETTFLAEPADSAADYSVRIFTGSEELPFAGHPTLGSCRVWLDHGGTPKSPGVVVQECAAGLVTIVVTDSSQSFAAPPMIRTGVVDDALVGQLAKALQIDRSEILDTQWVDNGPRWIGVLLNDAEAVLALELDPAEVHGMHIGVAGLHPAGSDYALEVRAFFQSGSAIAEDPVTGSLNASMAQWLLRVGRLTAPYIARQGVRLGRDGRVHVSQDADGTVWVGGDVVTCIRGTVDI